MPTKNRSDIIHHAINSVLAQTHQNFELLIVDDGSDDYSTKRVVDSFSDARILFLRTPPSGVVSARNTGLEAASGEYISFLDSDNTWDENFLRYSLLFLWQKGSKACFSGLQALNDDNEVIYYRCNDFDRQMLFEKKLYRLKLYSSP
ncbi:glycosyltransferase [Synechococcus sp. AH-601-B19]|nr:glycosyltransferase [Synechococcus sp. AH-601-B19]